MNAEKWFKAYLIAWFIGGIGGSIYFTYSRPYLRDMLGETGYVVVGYLLAAEQIPTILSILTGFLADRIGRRKLLLLGILNLPLYAILGYINPLYLPLAIAAIGIIGSLSGPATLGTILHATGRSGKAYSYLMMIAAIGWVIGGILPGLLIDYIGPIGLFTLTGLLRALAITLQYVYYPRELIHGPEKIGFSELFRAIKGMWEIVLSTILAIAALSLFYNVIALKVYSEIHNLLVYGVALSASTALASAFVRPYAGRLVDKYDPLCIIAISLIAYIFLDTSIYLSTGLLLLILYIIPIYPFRDTATVMAISRRTPLKLQATAAGINAATTSLSGLIVLLLTNIIGKNLFTAYLIHLALIMISLMIITHLIHSKSKVRQHTHS